MIQSVLVDATQLVGAAEHDFPDECFHGPLVLDQAEGEVVEERGVTGALTGFPEIINGANQSFAKEVFPDPVCGDPFFSSACTRLF